MLRTAVPTVRAPFRIGSRTETKGVMPSALPRAKKSEAGAGKSPEFTAAQAHDRLRSADFPRGWVFARGGRNILRFRSTIAPRILRRDFQPRWKRGCHGRLRTRPSGLRG